MKLKLAIILVIASPQIWALELPSIFSSHMVLQQEMPVRIWGKAEPETMVQVEFAGQKVSGRATADGDWALSLEPMEASFEGRSLKVSSGETVRVYEEVLVGEVWLGSGQSNMQWSVEMCADGDILLLGANDPYLRLHQVNYAAAREPRFSDQWNWSPDRSNSSRYISSVAYQFARDLRVTLGVPVGIINSSVGGTPSIAWTRSQAIAQVPQLMAKEAEWEAALARYDESLAAWETEYAEWRKKEGITEGNYEEHKRLGAPGKPEDASSPNRPASLANGMIAPIAGYTIRGVIWYQGEEDAKWEPSRYDERLQTMIEDWRQWWGMDDLPFGIVQLANLGSPREQPTNSPWANIRECQRRVAQSDPDIGLVVTIDVGEANDIHPRDKFTVARRLARWALADVYGKIGLRGGPEIASAVREGSAVVLRFNEVGKGLHIMDSHELKGFTASDSLTDPEQDNDFYFVEAQVLSADAVSLKIPEGRNPARIRYAWQMNPVEANLSNGERLPASPFEVSIAR